MSQFFRTTVSARVLKVGDIIDGEKVMSVDTTTLPGMVFVSAVGDTNATAHMFNHGDPVRVTRITKED